MNDLIYSVEDDLIINNLINEALTKQGYKVKSFFDAKTFFKAIEEKIPKLILLDLGLPEISGMEILKTLRNNNIYDNIDIMIVSSNTSVFDIAKCMEYGANDFIKKPFKLLDLVQRVNERLKEYKQEEIIIIRDISLNLNKNEFRKLDQIIKFTKKEYGILKLLFASNGKVISRDEILNTIWGNANIYNSRTVDMHIKSIRKKIKDYNKNIILTIFGEGYKINIS